MNFLVCGTGIRGFGMTTEVNLMRVCVGGGEDWGGERGKGKMRKRKGETSQLGRRVIHVVSVRPL